MDWLSPIVALLESLPAVRVIIGFTLVFFLPGFAWTLVFFHNHQLNIIERIALSFGLSIPVVTLSIIVMNRLVGIRITALNSFLIILVVTIIPIAVYYLNKLLRQSLGGGA